MSPHRACLSSSLNLSPFSELLLPCSFYITAPKSHFFLHEHIVMFPVPLNLWPINLLRGFTHIHQRGIAFGKLYGTWPGSSCLNCPDEMGHWAHCTCTWPIATTGDGVCLWVNPSPLGEPTSNGAAKTCHQ